MCRQGDRRFFFLSLDFFRFYSVAQSYRLFNGELVIFLKRGERLGSAVLS